MIGMKLPGYDRWKTTEPEDELAQRAADAAGEATTDEAVEAIGAEAVFGVAGWRIKEEVMNDSALELVIGSAIANGDFSEDAFIKTTVPALRKLYSDARDAAAQHAEVGELHAAALLEKWRERPDRED